MQDLGSSGGTGSEGVRKRTAVKSQSKEDRKDVPACAVGDDGAQADDHSENDTKTSAATDGSDRSVRKGSFWLTRIVILRYLGFIYFVAFLVAYHQNKQLIGPNGLLPVDKFLKDVLKRTNGLNFNTFSYVPSILWLFDFRNNLPMLLDGVALAGLTLSGFVIIFGAANWIIMLCLWILYHSLVNVGQQWYGFGWESQLLETSFLATFLCPVFSLRQVPRGTPTSFIVIVGYRWLIFRIMLGAGLIKIRGDKCWRDFTCMNYHYETQPVPNPMSYYMHQSPQMWHQFETLSNHFIELVAPFLLVMPRRFCMVGGAFQILFQVVLIISGNLSFLNWLTILPCLACYDDASLAWMFSHRLRRKIAHIQQEEEMGTAPPLNAGNYIRRVFNISLGVLIAYLSIPVVQNLLSSRQAMNTSFDPLRLVNTYGAFGSVTKKRTEVIFQGTSSPDPQSPTAVWEEYEFKCKPGNITRRPCLISPYHYRLDWLMWFAAFQNYQHNPWLVHLAVKLLINDDDAVSLIAHNPFQGREPPKYIRAEHYRYRYTKIHSSDAANGAWWRRSHLGNYMPPLSIESARSLVRQMGWKMPKIKRS